MICRSLIILFCLVSHVWAGEIAGRVYLEKNKASIGKTLLRMHVYKDDYEFSAAQIITDASGRYRFPNLDTSDRFVYIIYPIYEGVNYPYEEVVFEPGQSKVIQDFPISESTGSTENIVAEESIYFEFGKKDIWKITHEITLENKGDLLYHSDRSDSKPLKFSLFEGGFDLAYLNGVTRNNSKIDDQEDTLQVMLTLPAHKKASLKFSYYFLPEARHVNFSRISYLERSNVTLFFNNNIRIVSNQFQTDPMMLQGKEDYTKAFTSGPVKTGDKINFEIKGFFLQRDFLHLVVMAACMAFIILMLVIAVRHKRRSKKQDKELTEKMQRYLIDLRKQRKEGTLDEHQFKKVDHKVRNFLFQMSKMKTNDRD